MFQFLIDNNLIKSSKVENAFLEVDRKFYSPDKFYEDTPVKIGFGATISAPHMVRISRIIQMKKYAN